MCGIVGYIGNNDVKNILLDGLEKLEYRGYDSAGIAVVNDGIHIFKDKGRIANLREQVTESLESTVGIGHTRWATHGSLTEETRTRTNQKQGDSQSFIMVSLKMSRSYVKRI